VVGGKTVQFPQYDALNRLKRTANYDYDTCWIGALCSTTMGMLKTSFTYDTLSRVQTSTQTTDGRDYGFSYEYTLADGLKSETYPSQRVVTIGLDEIGRTQSVSSGGVSYAGAIGYAAHGAVSSFVLGNGLTEQSCYNKRLQVGGVRLGNGLGSEASDGSCSVLSGDLWSVSLDLKPGSNNGNVWGQTMRALKPDQSTLVLSQSYGYL
jgi:hypothetical protein